MQLLGQRHAPLCSRAEPGRNRAALKRNAFVQQRRGFQHRFPIMKSKPFFSPFEIIAVLLENIFSRSVYQNVLLSKFRAS